MSKYEEDVYEKMKITVFSLSVSLSAFLWSHLPQFYIQAGGGTEEDKSSCSKLGLYFNTF